MNIHMLYNCAGHENMNIN